MDIIPVGITANRNSRTLIVKWKDGHVSEYPFYLLRFGCPCVECRGGHDQMSDRPPIDVFDKQPEESQRTSLEELEPVGTYALGIKSVNLADILVSRWVEKHNLTLLVIFL